MEMAALGEPLFYRRDHVDLDTVLRNEVVQLREKVDALSDQLFAEKSDQEIAVFIANQEAVKPLSVDFSATTASVDETQVEVHDQFGFEHGTMCVPGLTAKKSIPFKGNPNFWHLRPNQRSTNLPRGKVQEGKLIIGISVRTQEADEAARYLDATIAQLPEYLQRQEAQITQHNASLGMHALQWITLRRQRLTTASDLLKKLGG
jgi:hypothetical protein